MSKNHPQFREGIEQILPVFLLVAINPSETLSKAAVGAALGLSPGEVGVLMEEGTFPYTVDRGAPPEEAIRIPRVWVACMLIRMSKADVETFLAQLRPLFHLIAPGQVSAAHDAFNSLAASLPKFISKFGTDNAH